MRIKANEPFRVALGLPDGTRVQVTAITTSGVVYLAHNRQALLNSEPYSSFAAGEFAVTEAGGAVELSWRGDLWAVSFTSDCEVVFGVSGAPQTKAGTGAPARPAHHGLHSAFPPHF